MKKSLLLSITWITLVALTATTLYAQTTTGTSIIDKMKEAMRPSFTLSADLNPGQTGYESAPVSGKKTGNMLTAAEWNRMLEIVAQGGAWGGGSGWVDVPLTDTADFDTSCVYRFDVNFIVDDANRKYMNATSAKAYMIGISNKFLQRFLDAGNSWMWGIESTDKSKYGYRNSSGVFTVTNNVQITKLEKLCGGVGGGSTVSNPSPIFHYCTNAQSLDSTNAPCYGASRNQWLWDGRYRVVSCHIIGSTGHESINSQLLNFWRTGLAAMQNKWNSLYTDSQWQLCIDGSVLVADTQGIASGGGTSSTGNRPIVCSKTANSWKPTGYIGAINVTFSAADCTGGVLPDTTTYAWAIQGMQVCGGVETFTIQGTTVRIFTNNLCKWASGKDYYFTVLYVPL